MIDIPVQAGANILMKHPLQLTRNLGLFVGGLGLVYVALWWQSHAAQAGGPLQALALVLGSALA